MVRQRRKPSKSSGNKSFEGFQGKFQKLFFNTHHLKIKQAIIKGQVKRNNCGFFWFLVKGLIPAKTLQRMSIPLKQFHKFSVSLFQICSFFNFKLKLKTPCPLE